MNEKLREALAIVEKYGMKGDVIYKEIEALAASKQEPQAQAEPEVPARLLYWHGPRHYAVPHGGIAARTYAEFPKQEADKPDSYWKNGPELITLQSHREAMAEVVRRFDELKRHGVSHHVHNEAIAKKDAALKACVIALRIADKFCGEHTPESCPDTVALPIKDAITQAEEARKS